MTALMPAGSPLLQELADGSPLDPDARRMVADVEGPVLHRGYDRISDTSLAALRRVHDKTRLALASTAERTGSRPKEQ